MEMFNDIQHYKLMSETLKNYGNCKNVSRPLGWGVSKMLRVYT